MHVIPCGFKCDVVDLVHAEYGQRRAGGVQWTSRADLEHALVRRLLQLQDEFELPIVKGIHELSLNQILDHICPPGAS